MVANLDSWWDKPDEIIDHLEPNDDLEKIMINQC